MYLSVFERGPVCAIIGERDSTHLKALKDVFIKNDSKSISNFDERSDSEREGNMTIFDGGRKTDNNEPSKGTNRNELKPFDSIYETDYLVTHCHLVKATHSYTQRTFIFS